LRIQTEGFKVATQQSARHVIHVMLDYIAPLQGGDWGKAYEVD
jgi:hypothetical protein